MLDIGAVDLGELAMALEDHSPEHSWWLDPRTGELELWSDYDDSEGREHPEERDLLYVDPIGSGESYGDMQDFASRLGDPRARDLLVRALEGRGAFRRFKDTLFEFPEIRDAWFRFHDVRVERRVIEWLRDSRLITEDVAAAALATRPDVDLGELGTAFDATEIARAVAADLAELYGERLKQVVLFGSWARGDAHPESDIDLLVVLDEVQSRWRELDRMHDVTWRHSLENDTVVAEIPVGERDWRESDEPLIVRARAEGVLVA